MINNISTNNISFTITIGAVPVVVDNFSADSDIWQVNDVECGGMQVTPDGKFLRYGKNYVINASLTLNGASKALELIRQAINAQSKNGAIDSILLPVSVVIINNGHTESFLDGTIISGAPGISYGNQALSDQTINFAFSKRIYV